MRHAWKLSPLLSRLPIDIAPSILHALHSRSPIVALESTVISHGLNPPHSLLLPRECNNILENLNVTPAAIGIIGGRIKVGLTDFEIDHLAKKGYNSRQKEITPHDTPLWKVGRRELGAALVNVSSNCPRYQIRHFSSSLHRKSTQDSPSPPRYTSHLSSAFQYSRPAASAAYIGMQMKPSTYLQISKPSPTQKASSSSVPARRVSSISD